MSTLMDDDMGHLLKYVDRLLEAINEYDPADALHEMLDIDPTDPVNARAHRKAHERRMGEWHDRVVGRDKVISEVKVALTQGITTDKEARRGAIRVIDNWLNRDRAALAPVAPDAEPERLTSACKCGDCFHPVIGPNTDGEPCDWCRDCACPSADHTRMTYTESTC